MEDFKGFIKKMNISEIPATILEGLINKKRKEETFRNRLLKCALSLLCTVILFIIYFIFKTSGTGNIGSNPLSFILEDKIFLMLFMLFFILLGRMTFLQKKFDKAEKEVDALREEIIDRSSEIWDTIEDWNQRVIIYKHLNETYDINLFHK